MYFAFTFFFSGEESGWEWGGVGKAVETKINFKFSETLINDN